MAKIKTVSNINIPSNVPPTSGSTIFWSNSYNGVFGTSAFLQAREYNKKRFKDYCHIGTIIKHGTSRVDWEIIGITQIEKESYGPGFTVFYTYEDRFVIQAVKGGPKGKKYKKVLDLEQFYMYDVIDVPPAVKVLWGDPKDNPPKNPKDFEIEVIS